MKQYLLSIMTPQNGTQPPPEVLEPLMREVEAINQEMKAAGAWVFANGLSAPSTATVVQLKDGEVLTTDGPHLEGKEYIGGLNIVRAANLDEALVWGRKLAKAIALPIEVRPFEGEVD